MIFPWQHLLEGWRETRDADGIRLVLLDVDGCLTGGEASPLNFDVLSRLQKYNRASANDSSIPAVTLCTGRQEPYVELLTQAIGGFLPALWENGAGLYVPAEYRFRLHPLIDSVRLEALAEARRAIANALVSPGLAYPQPGKEVSITLYPSARCTVSEVAELAAAAIDPLSDHFWISRSLTTVEVLPVGIHKGSGVRWLLDELGMAAERSLGIGDSPSDLAIFRETGHAATVPNAATSVREAAEYVAPRESSLGVLDIMSWCIARNRAGE